MQDSVIKVLKYILIGILTVPVSIVTHELGHFFAYQIFVANNVQLHAFSVSADKENLSNLQNAAAVVTGPIITYATVGLAYFFTQKIIIRLG